MKLKSILLLALLAGCTKSSSPPLRSYGFHAAGIAAESDNSQQAPAVAPAADEQPEVEPPEAFISKVRSAEVDGQSVLQYLDPTKDEETWVTFGNLKTYDVGTQFYHWGPAEDIQYWATNGISNQDIANAVATVDQRDVEGGGFYVSANPTDSADYGTNVLVAQPAHALKVLDLSRQYHPWKKEKLAFDTFDMSLDMGQIQVHALLPSALLVEFGIEAIQYSDTWHVCINGSALETLFEGSWSNFAKHSGGENFSLETFVVFKTKYPLTKEFTQSSEFHEQFPLIASYLDGVELSEETLKKEASKYTELGTRYSNFTGLTQLKADPDFASLYTKLYKYIVLGFREKLDSLLASGDTGTLENQFFFYIAELGLQLSDLDDSYTSVIPESYQTWFGRWPGGYSFLPNAVIWPVADNIGHLDFYNWLNDAINDRVSPPLVSPQLDRLNAANPGGVGNAANAQPLDNQKPMTAADTCPAVALQSADPSSIEPYVKYWSAENSQTRDEPLLATGSYHIEGSDKPGFLKVSRKQKQEIESNPLLESRFVERENEQTKVVEIFVQYSYPSARNYKKFQNLIYDPQLLSDLYEADSAGMLADTSSVKSRELTSRIVRHLTSLALRGPQSVLKHFYDLNKIHPIKDEDLNRKALRSYLTAAAGAYRSIIFFDDDWDKTLLYPELAQISAFNENYTMSLLNMGLGDGTNDKLNLNQAIGVWAIAADHPPPYIDGNNFIAQVKARFLSEDVQAWIKTREYPKVRKALREAGAGL